MVFHRLMRESEGASFVSELGKYGGHGYGGRGGALNMDNFVDNESGDGKCVHHMARQQFFTSKHTAGMSKHRERQHAHYAPNRNHNISGLIGTRLWQLNLAG